MVPSVTLHMSAQAYSGVAENRARPKASSILGHRNGKECISDVTQQNHILIVSLLQYVLTSKEPPA